MFFTRMLFSCLVDADYTDTGAFMDNSPYLPASSSSMEELWRRLETYVSGWFPPKGALNMQRCAILEQCMSAGAQYGPGLFTLTVPTGGGKTVASLSFALAQAKARRMKRIVYVIPYTSIIEQTAQVFREILGDENVLEFHFGVQFDQQEDDTSSPEAAPLTRSVETWDVPVIVTTAVQFFESLYACQPSKCRKLHNLAQSVLIFDEAQMLPICAPVSGRLPSWSGTTAPPLFCVPPLSPLWTPFFRNSLRRSPSGRFAPWPKRTGSPSAGFPSSRQERCPGWTWPPACSSRSRFCASSTPAGPRGRSSTNCPAQAISISPP